VASRWSLHSIIEDFGTSKGHSKFGFIEMIASISYLLLCALIVGAQEDKQIVTCGSAVKLLNVESVSEMTTNTTLTRSN
jgi:hypothetical protein